MHRTLFIIAFVFLSTVLLSQTQEVPYTLADRDRMIQLKSDVESIRNEMGSLRNEMGSLRNEMLGLRNEMNTNMRSIDARFENIERHLDDQKTFLYWGFGILFSFMLFLVGFVLWDRRTMIKPVIDDVEKLKKENEAMKEVFRKQVHLQPQLRQILKNAGIL